LQEDFLQKFKEALEKAILEDDAEMSEVE